MKKGSCEIDQCDGQIGRDIRRDVDRNSMGAKDVLIWRDVAHLFSSWSASHGWGGRWVKKLSVSFL